MARTVVIDVKKTYRIEVLDGEDPDFIPSTRIESEGKLIDVETSVVEVEDDNHDEWRVDCPNCGQFTQIQKSDPVLCPQCQSPDIETDGM